MVFSILETSLIIVYISDALYGRLEKKFGRN